MGWNLDLSKLKIAAAGFGGPVAVRRDDTKIMMVSGDVEIDGVRLFSSAGEPLAKVNTPGEAKIVKMGWTNKEQLVVVFK